MSVVHFYYFLQLKIIWAIKLKSKFIFFSQMSIYLAIRFQVFLAKFSWRNDTWKCRKLSSLWAEVWQGDGYAEERGFLCTYLQYMLQRDFVETPENTSFFMFAFECSQESVKTLYLLSKSHTDFHSSSIARWLVIESRNKGDFVLKPIT